MRTLHQLVNSLRDEDVQTQDTALQQLRLSY